MDPPQRRRGDAGQVRGETVSRRAEDRARVGLTFHRQICAAPSETNCTASAASTTPSMREKTIAPVLPSRPEMRSAARKAAKLIAMVRAMIDFLVSGGPIGTSAASPDAGSATGTLPGFDAGFTFPTLDAGLGSLTNCVTDSNTDHVLFGRAHVSGSSALANGSNDNLGADSALVWTSLQQTSTGVYTLVPSCL